MTERGWQSQQPVNRGLNVASMMAGAATILVLSGLLFLIVRGSDDRSLQASTGALDVSSSSTTETAIAAAPAETAAPGTSSPEVKVLLLDAILDDPLGRTEAVAVAKLRFDTGSGEFCYEVSMDGMDGPYDGHVHVGPAGVKGGIVIDMGALTDSPIGCVTNRLIDTEVILADLSGHYIEFHDPDGVRTIRAQLALAEDLDEDDAGVATEAADKGAVIKIEAGAVALEGEVPDQVTVDKFLESFADIDLGATELVNRLTIRPGAPRPSGKIVVDDAVLFEIGLATLSDVENSVILDLATIFKARPAWTMKVVGHTDNTGSPVANLELSLERAVAVRDVLVANGVSADVLTIEGAGDTNPVASNDTDVGRGQNRRIEFEVEAG